MTESDASKRQAEEPSFKDVEAQMPPTPAPVASVVATAGAIGAYCTISIGIVYYNWWLFTKYFQYPIFASWAQQATGFLLFMALAGLGKYIPVLTYFPLIAPDIRTALKVLPLSCNFVLMVGLANLCLKYVQVSTYQVARSLTIFFTMIFSHFMLSENFSSPIKASCAVIVVGFVIGSLDPSTLSVVGVMTGGASSVFQAMYNVLTKRTLAYVNDSTQVMLFYNLGWSSLLFIPVIVLFGEAKVIYEFPSVTSREFPMLLIFLSIGGVLATSMNLAGYACVKFTSPLTFNIVGITKSLVQSLGGIVLFGDVVSLKSIAGLAFSLGGSCLYSLLSWREKVKAAVQAGLKMEPKSIPSSASTEADGGDTLNDSASFEDAKKN